MLYTGIMNNLPQFLLHQVLDVLPGTNSSSQQLAVHRPSYLISIPVKYGDISLKRKDSKNWKGKILMSSFLIK